MALVGVGVAGQWQCTLAYNYDSFDKSRNCYLTISYMELQDIENVHRELIRIILIISVLKDFLQEIAGHRNAHWDMISNYNYFDKNAD